MSTDSLSTKQRAAVGLVARGDRTIVEIAAHLDLNRKTVDRWLRTEAFTAAVAAEQARIREAIRAEGIANKQNRVDALNRRHALMEQVIAERAGYSRQALRLAEVLTDEEDGTFRVNGREIDRGDLINQLTEDWTAPGAETGLLARTVRYLPGGGKVVEWAVDAALLAELRATEKHVAQELEQWHEGGANGGAAPVQVSVTILDGRDDVQPAARSLAATWRGQHALQAG